MSMHAATVQVPLLRFNVQSSFNVTVIPTPPTRLQPFRQIKKIINQLQIANYSC